MSGGLIDMKHHPSTDVIKQQLAGTVDFCYDYIVTAASSAV